MSPEEVEEAYQCLETIRREDAEEWIAQPKQALASSLAERATETLYGGAAGGGKSEWLLHYALEQMLNHPFNRGVIFRRLFPSLERTLIPRAKQMYPKHGGIYNAVKHTWVFPNGSVLEMTGLQYEDTVLEHQGTEYGFIGFEEITEFLESQVDYMIGRLRAPGPGIRPHMVSTANPGGRGHRWVKRRWVKPKETDYTSTEPPKIYQVWNPAPTPLNPEPVPRVFVPATLADNPILVARDPGYRNRLRALAGSNKALAIAMEHGDWDAIDAIEGALWAQSDLDGGRVTAAWLKQLGVSSRVLAIDPSDGNEDGKGDEYGVAVISRGLDGCGYTEYTAGWRATPATMAKKSIQLAADMGCDEIVVEKNHGGKWVKAVLLQQDRYANIKEVWASEGKMTRARPVAALFEKDEMLEDTPWRARLVGQHEKFEDEATTFTGQPGEVSPNVLDAVVWGYSRLFLGLRVAGESKQYQDERHRGRR